jgi:hypothetical protein
LDGGSNSLLGWDWQYSLKATLRRGCAWRRNTNLVRCLLDGGSNSLLGWDWLLDVRDSWLDISLRVIEEIIEGHLVVACIERRVRYFMLKRQSL